MMHPLNYAELMTDFRPYIEIVLDNFTEEEIGHKYSGDILHSLISAHLITQDPASMDKATYAIKLLQFYVFQRKFGSMRETA